MGVATPEQQVERLDRRIDILFRRTAWLEQELYKVTGKKPTYKEEKEGN